MTIDAGPTFQCARCGATGEFLNSYDLCELCMRFVYEGHLLEGATAEQAVTALLRAVGQDPKRDGLRDTPRRVARMLRELLRREEFEFTTFDAEGMNELVVVSDIPFTSFCEHHMLPFMGTAVVGYIPRDKIVGLSKLARAVRYCAAGLQNQERITRAVAELLVEKLEHPEGVGVVLRARHTCMEARGVLAAGALTTTSAMRGAMLENETTRAEFLALAGVRA